MELNTTLLRERFVIRDLDPHDATSAETLIAMSNRLVVPLRHPNGDVVETFIVRARVMHSAIRMAAQIIQTYQRSGPIMARQVPFNFKDGWDMTRTSHDEKYSDKPWICLYNNSKVVFSEGSYHPFLDVIEKCDSKNPGNYDGAVLIAEDTFKKMGRSVSISHNSNIGMVAHVNDEIGRCGLILRNPYKNTTFNFVAERKSSDFGVSPVQCLNVSAAFLEGIQISVRLGMNNELIAMGKANSNNSPEAFENISARKRLEEISTEINGFENMLDVRFRPERPDFAAIAKESAEFQHHLIESSELGIK